ncbi:MAG: AMP-binding protein, partial [Firmicutes bacterium]|nr:AMP-binding protein [Bacillota bacterium]
MSVSVLDDAFRKATADARGRVALVYLGEAYTFGDLDELVERASRGLVRLGVAEGERVVLYLPHCPQWLVVWLALQRLGAVAVPASHQYAAQDVAYIVADAGARVLVCSDTLFGYAARVHQQVPLRALVVTGLGDLLPWWKRALGRALDRLPTGRVKRLPEVCTFREVLSGVPRLPAGPTDSSGAPEAGLCELLYTGGTLGHPKGVPVSQHALLRRLISAAADIMEMGYSVPEDPERVADEAEQRIYEVARRDEKDQIATLRELVDQAILDLEHIQNRESAFAGLPTGFRDLDALLSGLQ